MINNSHLKQSQLGESAEENSADDLPLLVGVVTDLHCPLPQPWGNSTCTRP